MTLRDLNALDADAGSRALLRCCGSTRWAREMSAARPFASADAMAAKADAVWAALDRTDWLEAFAAHPKIGQPGGAGKAGGAAGWPDDEQRRVADAAETTRARLAQANREYEARFGYIFIVCATGKSAAEMLGLLERRMANDPAAELAVAAGEQRKITQLRLAKLLMNNVNNAENG
ncbi:MAG: 2-oxo-4-hydroxy-4-carboxy-5-ureidoimidazoline decarboxylase [Acidobacteria bacterium]|nr:2-oxo-4-hydroxy-4-carboxy-5-ureidoimidazoline decarboxylase [Acidobacteriota bacterium]